MFSNNNYLICFLPLLFDNVSNNFCGVAFNPAFQVAGKDQS